MIAIIHTLLFSVLGADNNIADVLAAAKAVEINGFGLLIDLMLTCGAAHLLHGIVEVRKAGGCVGMAEGSASAVGIDGLIALYGGSAVLNILPALVFSISHRYF